MPTHNDCEQDDFKSKNESDGIVVGENIDLLVLLIVLTPKEKKYHLFKTWERKERKTYLLYSYSSKNEWNQSILFLHVISGCNIVSCFF